MGYTVCSLVAFQISSEIFILLFHLIVSALFYSSVEPSESAGDVWWACRSYQYLAVSSWSATGWDWKKTSKQAGGNREGRQPLVSQGWYAVVRSPVLSVVWGFSWSSLLSICRDGRNSDGRGFSVTGFSSGWWRWNFFLTTTDVYFKYLESIVSITPMFVFDFSLEIISLSFSPLSFSISVCCLSWMTSTSRLRMFVNKPSSWWTPVEVPAGNS